MKDILKKLEKFIPICVVLFIISIAIIKLFNIKYHVADDYLMNNIVSGELEDSPDYQILYASQLIGIFLPILYKITSVINWYAIFLIFLQCVSFSIIVYRILHADCVIKKIISTILTISLFIFTLFNITFTIIAYLCIGTALIDFINKKSITKTDCVIYSCLVFTGILLRQSVLFPVLISIGLVVIYELAIKRDKIKAKYFALILIIPILLSTLLAKIFLMNNNYKIFINWQGACANLRDYKKIDYNKYQDIIQKVGWSENDLDLLYTWAFADKYTYSEENMKYIFNNVSIFEKYNFNIKAILTNFAKQFSISQDMVQCYIIIFVLLLFMVIVNKNSKRREAILMLLVTVFVNILLIVRNRYLFRVVYPQYLIAMIYYIYILMNNIDLKSKFSKIFMNTSCILVVIFIIIFTYNNHYKTHNTNCYMTECIEYINNNKQNLYISDSSTYNEITMNYDILQSKSIGKYNNLIKLGGGDAFSRRYYYYATKFKLEDKENLYANLSNDNVYYIGYIYPEVICYLDEHGYDLDFFEVDRINDIVVYKFKEKK